MFRLKLFSSIPAYLSLGIRIEKFWTSEDCIIQKFLLTSYKNPAPSVETNSKVIDVSCTSDGGVKVPVKSVPVFRYVSTSTVPKSATDPVKYTWLFADRESETKLSLPLILWS